MSNVCLVNHSRNIWLLNTPDIEHNNIGSAKNFYLDKRSDLMFASETSTKKQTKSRATCTSYAIMYFRSRNKHHYK